MMFRTSMFVVGALALSFTLFYATPVNSNDDPETIKIGAYKLPNPETATIDTMKKKIDEMRKIGISYAWLDVWGVPGNPQLQKVLNYADQVGFQIVLHLNIQISPLREISPQGEARWKNPLPDSEKPYVGFSGLYGMGEKQWAQRWKDDSIAYEGTWRGHPYPMADMWAPAARGIFRRTLRNVLEKLATHPSVKYISYDDEYRYWYDFFKHAEGQAYFSPWSSKVVSALSNLTDIKKKTPDSTGYIATGNDSITALRYTIEPTFVPFSYMNESTRFHINDLSRVFHDNKRYGIEDFTTTGGMGTNSAITLARCYATERAKPVLESIFGYDYAKSTSRKQQKMFSLIGWWSGKKSDFYSNQIKVLSRFILLRGPESIAYASIQQMFKNPDSKRALVESFKDIKKYGPMFKQLEIQNSKVGLLWSDGTGLYQQQTNGERDKNKFKDTRSWRWLEHYVAVACLGYPALCQAGYIPQIITEKDVLDESLSGLDVLVMLNHQCSESRLMRKYAKFIKRGGIIITDESSNIKVPGSVFINFDASIQRKAYENGERNWWDNDKVVIASYKKTAERINKLANDLKSKIAGKTKVPFSKESSNGVIITALSGCGAKYMVAINSNMFSSETATIHFSHNGPIYRLEVPGEKVEYGKEQSMRSDVNISLPPNQMTMWLLTERPLAKVYALVVCNDDPAVIRCQLWDDEGFPMRGVIPFKVKTGENIYYGATKHGIGYVWLPEGIDKKAIVTVSALGKTIVAQHMP